MSQWYYSDYDRNRHGPVQASDLVQLHEAGQLSADTMVWKEGWAQWKPWRDAIGEVIPGGGRPAVEAANFATARGDAPATAGNLYSIAEPRSPYAPPTAHLAGAGSVVRGGEVVYAGFWKRFAAYALDAVVITIVGVVVQMVLILGVFGVSAAAMGDPSAMMESGLGIGALVLVYLIPLGLQVAYYAMFHAGARQATLGKMAVGIKVVRDDGSRISVGLGIGRYFATIVSSLILLMGFVMAAFTDRKRALHDMMCNTLVVDQWAFTDHPERQNAELGTVTKVIIGFAVLLVVGYIGVIMVVIAIAASAAAGA